MSIKIRLASVDDIENLIKVRFDYFDIEKWEVSAIQHIEIENSLREYFTKYLNTDFFAAFVEVEDKIASVAFLSISYKPANLSFPTGKTGTIFNVLTYPKYRKNGYATTIMNFLLDIAKTKNLSYVDLTATKLGKPIYEKLGFTEEESKYTKMKLSLL